VEEREEGPDGQAELDAFAETLTEEGDEGALRLQLDSLVRVTAFVAFEGVHCGKSVEVSPDVDFVQLQGDIVERHDLLYHLQRLLVAHEELLLFEWSDL
jgi:hypothetical protein